MQKGTFMKFKNIVHVSKYEKNGEEKKKYQNVGTLFIFDDGGMSIKLDYIPTEFDGKLAVYDQKKAVEQTESAATSNTWEPKQETEGEFPPQQIEIPF